MSVSLFSKEFDVSLVPGALATFNHACIKECWHSSGPTNEQGSDAEPCAFLTENDVVIVLSTPQRVSNEIPLHEVKVLSRFGAVWVTTHNLFSFETLLEMEDYR